MAMHTLHTTNFRGWAKTSESPLARAVRYVFYSVRTAEIPAPKCIWKFLYRFHKIAVGIVQESFRVFYWTPLFKSQVSSVGRKLYLFGGLPYMAGPLDIDIGERCRISGKITITGRTTSTEKPKLSIGTNVDVGWMTTIAVGKNITIGDNVKIAGQCFLAGYPGHPIDATSRAKGEPELESQVGDIIIEKDVWLATGTSVMSSVVIGEGCIVAAQSVVTHSLPPYVLAGGSPAKIIRHLNRGDQ